MFSRNQHFIGFVTVLPVYLPKGMAGRYATRLLETGADLGIFKNHLVMKAIKTTELYTHVSIKSIQNLHSMISERIRLKKKGSLWLLSNQYEKLNAKKWRE